MKRTRNKDTENELKIAAAVEEACQMLGNRLGMKGHAVPMQDRDEDEESGFMKAMEDILVEKAERITDTKDHHNENGCSGNEKEPISYSVPDDSYLHHLIHDGDGEEIFCELMDDLLMFSDCIEQLQTILMAVSVGKLCPVAAMKMASDMVCDSRAALADWELYRTMNV